MTGFDHSLLTHVLWYQPSVLSLNHQGLFCLGTFYEALGLILLKSSIWCYVLSPFINYILSTFFFPFVFLNCSSTIILVWMFLLLYFFNYSILWVCVCALSLISALCWSFHCSQFLVVLALRKRLNPSGRV